MDSITDQLEQLQLGASSQWNTSSLEARFQNRSPHQRNLLFYAIPDALYNSAVEFARGKEAAEVLLEQRSRLQEAIRLGQMPHSDCVQAFKRLPQQIQANILNRYPKIIAANQSSETNHLQHLQQQISSILELLSLNNSSSLIELALQSGQMVRAQFLINQFLQQYPHALSYRCPDTRQTLAMLCVTNGNSTVAEFTSVLQHLVKHDPAQIHRCYDNQGCNLLHYCASIKSALALHTVLCVAKDHHDYIAADVSSATKASPFMRGLKDAIEMPNTNGDTPLHIAAAAAHYEHIALFQEFNKSLSLNVDFEVKQLTHGKLSPFEVATSVGAVNVQRLFSNSNCSNTQLFCSDQFAAAGVNSVDSGIASLESDVISDHERLDQSDWSNITKKLEELELTENFIHFALSRLPESYSKHVRQLASVAADPTEAVLGAIPTVLDSKLIISCLSDLGLQFASDN